MLVGKPGLDGHSNGAEQIAVAARDSGIEVVYEGIRLTPARIAYAALKEGVHIVGLSILSGSHMPLARKVLAWHTHHGNHLDFYMEILHAARGVAAFDYWLMLNFALRPEGRLASGRLPSAAAGTRN